MILRRLGNRDAVPIVGEDLAKAIVTVHSYVVGSAAKTHAQAPVSHAAPSHVRVRRGAVQADVL